MDSQILTTYSENPLDGRFVLLRRLYSAARNISVRQRWQIAIYLIGIFPGLWIVFMTQGSFNTPDEFSRHFAASTFAEHFKFTFSDEVTEVAEAGSVAPRGYTLTNGTAVPNHSLGFLLFLGIVHTFLPDVLVPTALVLISGLVFLVWANVINRLVNRSWLFTGLLVVGIAPLWYWVARPYMESAVVTLLLGVAVLWMINAYQERSLTHFKVAVVTLSLASLLRTPDAIFFGILILAFAAVYIHRTRSFRWTSSRDIYIWVIASQLAVFVMPTLILNWLTNGSPFTLGYTIFLSQEYPAEHSSSSNPITFVFSAIKQAVIPNNFDLKVLWNGLVYQVIFMNPALLVLGVTGLWMVREKIRLTLGRAGIAIAGIAVLYLLVSRADGETFGAFQTAPDLDISLVRYWIPIYLLLAVGVAFSLRNLPSTAHMPLVGLIAVQSVFMVFYTGTTPVPGLIDITRNRTEVFAAALSDVVEDDAIVVVTSSQDKWVAQTHRTIGVWNPTPETLANVGDTVVGLVERGNNVYLLDDRPLNTTTITEYVEPLGIESRVVESELTGISFVKFDLAPQVLELSEGSDGVFGTTVESPVSQFRLLVENDGSSTNYISYPSFENSIDGWAARGEGEITTSDEHALFGANSLKMEIADSADSGDSHSARVNIVTKDVPEDTWYVRVHVLPEMLDNAVAGVRIHVRDGEGQVLERGYEEITEASGDFMVLETPVSELPEGAQEILIQLAVIPQEEGASAVVYWDGVELLSSKTIEYCDGDTNGCEWTDESHTSTSSRESSLQSIKLISGANSITLEESALSGYSLVFDEGIVTLVGPDGEAVSAPEFFDWSVESGLSIAFEAESTPAIVFSTGEMAG